MAINACLPTVMLQAAGQPLKLLLRLSLKLLRQRRRLDKWLIAPGT
jgi:hypothetical protein